ncbi:MAG: site-specific integrase [Hyphomonas sp.]|nr:site-specific integrase [Hyphomonas sp.]
MSGHCIQCATTLQAYVPAWEIGDIYIAAANNAPDSSANTGGPVSGQTAARRDFVAPETDNINKRWLFRYQQYLVENRGYDDDTVDALAGACQRDQQQQAIRALLRETRHHCEKRDEAPIRGAAARAEPSDSCSRAQSLQRFFDRLAKQERVKLPRDLGGYFQLKKRERRLASLAVKGTELSFAQAVSIFRVMPGSDGIELRNKAIIALLLMTGIRVDALASLRGKHVDVRSWWINQLPPEVRTKHDKHIRSYCLDLGSGMREALAAWAHWRDRKRFSDNDAFFLPDPFITPNGIGLGYRSADAHHPAAPWKSTDRVRTVIRSAAEAAGFGELAIGAHDFRKVSHSYLLSNADMTERHHVALQLSLGHEPRETLHKHYSHVPDVEREAALDELCRMASGRSDTNLALTCERSLVPEDDPDYGRARQAHARANGAIRHMGFQQGLRICLNAPAVHQHRTQVHRFVIGRGSDAGR